MTEIQSDVRPSRADFDHYGPAMAEGALDVLAEMREQCPVAWSEQHGGFFAVTRYDECYELSRNPDVFGNGAGMIPDLVGGLKLPPIGYDPPEHGVYRDLLQSWFTLKRMQSFEPYIRECARTRVRALGPRAELVEGLTKPFPRDVILGVIGVPDADIETIGEMIDHRMKHATDDQSIVRSDTERLRDYFADTLIASRRAQPTDDLVSHLIASEIDGEPLSDALIGALLHQVIGAGIDTTNKVLATGLAHLAADPESQQAIRAADIETAVEEMLRLFPPVSVGRLCKADAVVGGVPVAKGERLLLMFASANRDAAHFVDPDRADWSRTPNRHMTFGVGIHRCLGMHLARMEMVIALEELFDHVTDLRLPAGAQPTYRAGQVWGVVELPVDLTFRG